MTARIQPALDALKLIMLAAAPVGVPAASAAYAYPADYASMPKPLNGLPAVVVHRMGARPRAFGAKAAGLDRHNWIAGIDILLLDGPLMNDEQIYQADRLFEPWLEAAKAALFENLTLSGTAAMIGAGSPNGDLFQYIDANIMWVGATYWGIRLELPILQTAAQTMTG